MACRYCDPTYQSSPRIVLENEHFFAVFDSHPVSPGHIKLIPKKHCNSFDELTEAELASLLDILIAAKALIRKRFSPDGWNIGWNEGKAAGQTVFHLHIHVIPRYKGDVADPTGGVRTILPKGNYLRGS